jgi:hypothetical protein
MTNVEVSGITPELCRREREASDLICKDNHESNAIERSA